MKGITEAALKIMESGEPRQRRLAQLIRSGKYKTMEDIPYVTQRGDELTKEELQDAQGGKKNLEPRDMPERLQTMGLLPVLPDEHKLIGYYESKQTLYLLIAHAYNKLQDRIDELEKKLKWLKKN